MFRFYVSMSNILARLHRDDRGATAVEYGLMVALIAAVIITAVSLVGNDISSTFSKVAQNM